MPDVTDPNFPHTLVTCEGQVSVDFVPFFTSKFVVTLVFFLRIFLILQNPEDKVNLGPLKFYPGVVKNGTEL